jgi:hypothetical protein
MRSFLRALAVLVSVVGPVAAQAATLDLTGAVGAAIASGSSDTATYSGSSAFGPVTFAANPAGSDLTHTAGSGLGIDCSGWGLYCQVDTTNQIDFPEVLEVSFTTPKYVTSVDISQLTSTSIELGRFSIVLEQDAGAVSGSGFTVPFAAEDADSSGRLQVAINQWASSIRFVPIQGFFEDFSVARITIDETRTPLTTPGSPSSPIPEPSSVLMMTLGGALVLLSLRKFAL